MLGVAAEDSERYVLLALGLASIQAARKNSDAVVKQTSLFQARLPPYTYAFLSRLL